MLETKHQETRQFTGLTKRGHFMELFASESGTWTAVQTNPLGVACIVAAGEGWETIPEPVKGEGV